MDLSSSLSGTKEFRIVKRGYDPDEVDAFLDQIAHGVAELKRKLAEANDRAAARPSSAPAPAPAPAPLPGATAEAEEIHRALILAQRAADEEVRKATEEAATLIDEARDRAEVLLREADRDVAGRREEGRAALLAEIRELEGLRNALNDDVVVLERHVEEQREVVQAAVGELQALLDHPEAFRIAAPASLGAATPAPASEVAPVEQPAPAPEPARAADVEPDGAPEVAGAPAPSAPEPQPAPPVEVESVLEDDVEPPAAPEPSPRAEESSADTSAGEATVDGLPPLAPPEPGGDPFRRDDPAPAPSLFSARTPVEESGPPTEAMAPVGDGEPDEDAFLAELRKAMLDDEPLGPRDEPVVDATRAPDEEPERGGGRPRFGRRR